VVKYELPRLPYAYDELEPYFAKQMIQIHHQKYHQSYVDGLNQALNEISGSFHPRYISSILSDLNSFSEPIKKIISYFGGAFENHKLFWETLTPKTVGSPGGKLEDSIDVYFGNFQNFKKEFSNHALSIEGSGWCWLVYNQSFNKIEIFTTVNHESPWMSRKIPLLGLDLWEHSYYFQYINKKSDYVSAWWNLVNWDYVGNRFSELSM
jgi:superoxide dismutase, Fe-Mn family